MGKNGFHFANRLHVHNVEAKVALVGSWRVNIDFMNTVFPLFFHKVYVADVFFPVFFGSRLDQGMPFLMRSSKLLVE